MPDQKSSKEHEDEMATLREYFDKDGSRTFCLNQTIEIRSASGEVELEVIGRLHLDLESNAKYISYYIPHSEKVACPARVIMNSVNDVLNWDQKVKFSGGFVMKPDILGAFISIQKTQSRLTTSSIFEFARLKSEIT